MKKFLTFLALVCLTVTGVWADNITSVDQAKEDGYYTIVCPRNALTVSSDMTTLASATVAGRTFSAYDPYFQFQFKKSGEDYILYNVGAAKYLTNVGITVDNISDANAITLFDWGNGTAQLRWDDNHALNIGGSMEIGINTWNRADDGNRYTVAEVEPCDVVIKGASVSVTINGETYANGAKIPLSNVFTLADVEAPAVAGYNPVVTLTGTQVVVNYQPVINLTDLAVKSVGAMTTTIEEGKWYVMTQTRDGETPVYDQGADQRLRTEQSDRVADIFTVLRPANEVANYLIRFISTGAQSHAIQFANGNYWYVTATPAVRNVGIVPDANNFQKFLLYEAPNTADGNKMGLGINATEDGVTAGYNLDHNNNSGGATLNFWSDGKITGGGNNVWYIYPVEIGAVAATTNVTYKYYFKGAEIATQTSEQEIGATVAAPPSITQIQQVFTAVEYDNTAVVAAGLTVNVNVVETTPFIAADSYENIQHWYALSIKDTNWLYNTGSAAVTGTGSYEISDKYAWAFVGNIFDGYVIYNKEAGSTVALSDDTPCNLTVAGTSVLWTIPRIGNYGENSFGLKTGTQDPINWQSNTLKRWSGFDGGSSFKVVELLLGEQNYTVNITGAPQGTKLSCNGNQYANGESFTADLAATPVTAPVIDGYFNPTIAVEGLDINVTYKKYPFEIADSYEHITHWYALNIHSNQTHYLYANSGAIAVNDTEYEETAEYAWGFVGNNTTGYSIYNKATGASVALNSATPCTLAADGISAGWIISTSKETSAKGLNGFCINVSGQQYVNYQGGQLKRWGSNDAGSTFTPYEIVFAPEPSGYDLAISKFGYSTICLPENAIIPTGVKIYCCTENADGSLQAVPYDDDVLISEMGFIVEGTQGTYTFEYTKDDYEGELYDELWTLSGVIEDSPTSDYAAFGDVYVLSSVNNQIGFYKYAGTTLAANKAFYLKNSYGVQGFVLHFGDTEGINAVMSATNLKAGYDIQGRRINKMQKGISILNGKKIIK